VIQFPKRYADKVQRFRVPVGFIMLAAFIWLSRPTTESILWGLPFSLLGLAIRAWAAGHLAKNENLARSGPYGHMRNPLYVGSFLLAGGLVWSSQSLPVAAIFLAAFIGIYLPVIQLEEQHLRNIFPEYGDYAKRVPSLWPQLRSAGGSEPFRAQLYKRNQEWKAALAYAAGLLWLLWRLEALWQ
jgi:protein-S-isoprenylcysteine O-methyltransferase Ste14